MGDGFEQKEWFSITSCSDSDDCINERSDIRRPIGNANRRLLGNANRRLLGNTNRRLLGNTNRRLLGNVNRRLLGNTNRRRLANSEMQSFCHVSGGYWAEIVHVDGGDVA